MIVLYIVLLIIYFYLCIIWSKDNKGQLPQAHDEGKECKNPSTESKKWKPRWRACIKGKVSYYDMTWFERLLTPYCLYMRNRGKKDFDEKANLFATLKALEECQEQLYKEAKAMRLPFWSHSLDDWFAMPHLKSAVERALSFAISNRQESPESFLLRYAYAYGFLEVNIRRLISNICPDGSLEQRRKLCETIVRNVSDDSIQESYLVIIREIDQQLHDEAEKARKKEAILCKIKHQQEIESNGGFANVRTGDDYERFVMFCVKEAGFPVKKVGQTGDFGADVIAEVSGKNLIIQCKFYSSPVGYDAVQQVYTAKSIYKGSWCCVVTNATFTRQAIEGGNKLGVRLLSHVDLEEYLKSLS